MRQTLLGFVITALRRRHAIVPRKIAEIAMLPFTMGWLNQQALLTATCTVETTMIVAEQFPRPIPTFAVRFGNARFTTRTMYVIRERERESEK